MCVKHLQPSQTFYGVSLNNSRFYNITIGGRYYTSCYYSGKGHSFRACANSTSSLFPLFTRKW